MEHGNTEQLHHGGEIGYQPTNFTVKILCIETDRSEQTVQTQIRLLLKSDQGLHYLPLFKHPVDALPHLKSTNWFN